MIRLLILLNILCMKILYSYCKFKKLESSRWIKMCEHKIYTVYQIVH